jgi:phosphate transport system substrate-binding protein
MKQRMCRVLAALLASGLTWANAQVSGAGSTFAEPLYKRWSEQFNKPAGWQFSYESVGSGEGIKRAAARQVDFGGSEEPLKRAELEQKGLRQFPIAFGAIVPVINVPGVPAGKLKLDAATLAGIYQGRITRWNDPALIAINEEVGKQLPALAIRPFYRSDSSGSTYALTTFLSAQSPQWKQAIGVKKTMDGAKGQGMDGTAKLAAAVKATAGAIGYVDYGRAIKEQLNIAQLPNRFGVYMQVSAEAIRSAAKFDTEKMMYSDDPDFYMVLANNDTYSGWPLTTATFAVLPAQASRETNEVLDFLLWGFRNGDKAAEALGYVPLTETMKVAVRKAWSRQYGYRITN